MMEVGPSLVPSNQDWLEAFESTTLMLEDKMTLCITNYDYGPLHLSHGCSAIF